MARYEMPETQRPPTPGVFGPCFDKNESVRRWLGMAEGRPLVESLTSWRDELVAKLKKSRDAVEIHQTQGSLVVVEKLLNLREELS